MVRATLSALLLLLPLSVSAQQLALDIRDGRVTLTATAVPVRQVLTEWARIGGTKVVGAERLTGAPLTLQLENVPEAEALDVILRGAAGYLAATRAVPGSGPSNYDRILVLASSTAPASSESPAAGISRTDGRFAPPRQVEDNAPDEPDTNPAMNPFAGAFAQPGVAPDGQPGAVPFGQPSATIPFGQPGQAMPFGQGGGNGLFVPVPQDQAPPVQGFFGAAGSATPGVIQQPTPQGQQPRRPPPRD